LGEDVRNPEQWVLARFQDALRLSEGIETVVNRELQLAFGADGQPGDRERIVFVVETVAELYEDALLWAEKVRTANVEDVFQPPLQLLGQMMDHLIEQVEQYGPSVSDSLEKAVAVLEAGGKPDPIESVLTVSVPPGVMDAFQAAMEAAILESRRTRQRK
jgi:hypothetical protein